VIPLLPDAQISPDILLETPEPTQDNLLSIQTIFPRPFDIPPPLPQRLRDTLEEQHEAD